MFTTSGSVGQAAPRGRRLVAIDLENVVGGAVQDADAVRWAKRHILEAIGGRRHDDQIVVAVSRAGLLPTGCAWTRLRYVVGSGVDGADRALLEVLSEDIAARFAEVVVVSGDGIFADKVATLAADGAQVTVVAYPEKLANRLRLAAHHVSPLPMRCYPNTFGDVA